MQSCGTCQRCLPPTEEGLDPERFGVCPIVRENVVKNAIGTRCTMYLAEGRKTTCVRVAVGFDDREAWLAYGTSQLTDEGVRAELKAMAPPFGSMVHWLAGEVVIVEPETFVAVDISCPEVSE